ncbi:AMP-binding protein, partial [bacterium]|nr:AMP-binding protein [bacterium]
MTWSEFRAMLQGSKGCLIDSQRRLSFRELAAEADAFGESIEKELRENSAVGIYGRNSIDYLIVLFGLLSCGRTPVPLNTRLTPAERQAVLTQAGAQAYIQSDKLSSAAERLCSIEQTIETRSATQSSIIICSSGSEGKVKAASLSLESFVRHARAVNEHLNVTESDHWLVYLPFFHVGGLTIPFRCALASANVTLLSTADPELIEKAIETNGITLISMVAASLEKLLDLRQDKPFPSHLRAIITGGGPVPS